MPRDSVGTYFGDAHKRTPYDLKVFKCNGSIPDPTYGTVRCDKPTEPGRRKCKECGEGVHKIQTHNLRVIERQQ